MSPASLRLGLAWAAAAADRVAAAAHSTGAQKVFFFEEAAKQLEETYWPLFAELFLEEGKDDEYPMPAASKVVDLLEGLKGVAGLAVHTMPGTTVTEGQGYAMLAAGMRRDLDALKGLTVGWQANGQGFEDTPPCGGCGATGSQHFDPKQVCTGEQPTGCLCKAVEGAYMPGWDMPYTELGNMGSATDGDSDAVMGLVYLAELTGEREYQEYAAKSIAAFVLEDLGFADPEKNSRPVPAAGDIPEELQTMWLWRGGTCWGGYDTSSDGGDDRNLCINPAYFSPGEWRAFAKFLRAYPELVPSPHKAEELAAVLDSAIAWGYNTLNRISCGNGLVSNWWTVPDQGWPWKGELKCQNSGTAAGAYYSDAARIPWRVTLDYLWFGDESSTDMFDEDGKNIGKWGAKEYANRWAAGWKALIEASPDAVPGSFPPMAEGTIPMRPDQVLPLLSNLEKCDFVPEGFTASPWNGWGAYPVVTCFQVPHDDVADADMQGWVNFLGQVGFDACTNEQYFDLGQEIVVSAMLGGVAWLPLGGDSPAKAPSPRPPRHTPRPTPKPTKPTTKKTTKKTTTAAPTTSSSVARPTTTPAPTPLPLPPTSTTPAVKPVSVVPEAPPTAPPTPAPTEPEQSASWNPFDFIGGAISSLIGRSEQPEHGLEDGRRDPSAGASVALVGGASCALLVAVALVFERVAGRLSSGRRLAGGVSQEAALLEHRVRPSEAAE